MRAKQLLYSFVLLGVLSASPAVATPLCSSLATANYATLMAQGTTGCQIYYLVFSNFTFASSATGTGTQPVATQMSYILINPGLSFDGFVDVWGFEFIPDLSVSGIGSEDIQIQYDINAGDLAIVGRHLGEAAVATDGATATVTEGPDCLFPFTCGDLPALTVTIADPHIDAYSFFPASSEIQVTEDMNVTSTTAGGTVSLSLVQDAVNVFPEPATPVLMLTGFLFIVA
ncbi:MAG: hypothetical protein ACLQU1_21585 [Bryobacteraceae bacterium]